MKRYVVFPIICSILLTGCTFGGAGQNIRSDQVIRETTDGHGLGSGEEKAAESHEPDDYEPAEAAYSYLLDQVPEIGAFSVYLDEILCMNLHGDYESLDFWRSSESYPTYLLQYMDPDLLADDSLYPAPVFTADVIDLPIEKGSLLYDYLQSPDEFGTLYDLDELYQMGITTRDISEEEFICFFGEYSDEIIMSIKLGDSMERVKAKLGEPHFYDTDLEYIGYRTNDCYFAIGGSTAVERIVFTKNYQLPDHYEDIIYDYLEHRGSFQEDYPGYSFRGQVARGGSSVVYPFGVQFHDYQDLTIRIDTNFSGRIPVSEKIVYTRRDSNQTRLRNYFRYCDQYKQQAVTVSPDGRKGAFEYTMTSLYEHNKIYIYSLDHSFAPRVFRPGYWVGDQMYWLDNDTLLYGGTQALGLYSVKAERVYDINELIDGINLEIQSVDIENGRINGLADARAFIIEYDLSDGVHFELKWPED